MTHPRHAEGTGTDMTQAEIESQVLGDESPLIALIKKNEELKRQIRANQRKIAKTLEQQLGAVHARKHVYYI